jgi:hypothetical protein
MTGDPWDDERAAAAYLMRQAADVLGAERAAILADRISMLARSISLVCNACREPIFGDAKIRRDATDG